MKYSAGKSTKRLFSSWWAPAIFAVSAVLAVYLPSVFYPFVGYDDNPYIILNPYLGNLDIDSLIGIWRSGGCAEENLYIPLTYTTYFIETGIFGKAPLPIHLDNVLLHLTNTSLFLFLLRRLGFARGTALVAVLAFALHPLQVEPVVWCMGRKDLLSVFFALLAIIAYSRPFSPNDDAIAAESSCRGPDAASNGSNSRKGFLSSMSLSVFFGLAAMLSKPVMIVLPAILLAYELCFRISKDKCDSTLSSWTFRLRNFDRERLGAVFALGASAVGVLCVNLLGSFRVPLHAASTRLCLVVSYASAEWLKRFLMFGTMQHQYIWPSDSDLASPLNTVISLLAAGLAFAILHRSKYNRRVLFGLFLFVLALLPPIAHLRYADKFIMADRYTYFPLFGLFIALAAFHETLRGIGRRTFGILCIASLALMLVKTREASLSWSNSLRFWNLEHETKPNNPEIAYFAGLMRQERGDYASALKLYRESLKNDPNFVRAYFATGSIFFDIGEYDSALKCYNEALRRDSPYKAEILANLAQTHIKKREIDSAIECFEKSLAIKDVPENRVWLARLLLFKSERAKARKEAIKALKSGAALTEDLKTAFPELQNSLP